MSDSLLLDTLRERRTVRRYTDQEVTMEEVKALLAAAMSAPSMLNRRPWHFVVVRAPETRELVVDSLRLHPGLGSAPVFVGTAAFGYRSYNYHGRYGLGINFYVTTRTDLTDPRGFEVTGGIEFDLALGLLVPALMIKTAANKGDPDVPEDEEGDYYEGF